MATVTSRAGAWKTVTIAGSGTTSSETDLGGQFEAVQCYNPAIDSATITIKPTRTTGGTAVQAYMMDKDATGDFVNTTTARTAAGMNVFHDLYAQYVVLVLGAAQDQAKTLYIRGIGMIE